MWFSHAMFLYPFIYSLMIVISWNCRGAQGLNFRRVLNNFCRKNKVDVVALQETRCSGSVARKAIKKLGFKNHIVSEA